MVFETSFRSLDSKFYYVSNGDIFDISNLDLLFVDNDVVEKRGGMSKRFLEHYWKLADKVLRDQMKQVKLDQSEFLFLSALIYWDFGITNQSEKCEEMCEKMRKGIFQELANYEKSTCQNGDHSFRVAEVMSILQAVQKANGLIKECGQISRIYDLRGKMNPLYIISDD